MCIAMHHLRERLRKEANIKSHLLRQFSPKVADQLLSHKGGVRLGGRRNEVTILSSDIRGFAQLSRDMEPDEVVDLLNQYWKVVVPVIFAYNGTVDKFMGDAVLAVFGSPEPDVNQQSNAVRAALEMQTALSRVNALRREAKLPASDFGIGIHCGQAVHGFVGTTDRMEFTVIGDTVNRTRAIVRPLREARYWSPPRFSSSSEIWWKQSQQRSRRNMKASWQRTGFVGSWKTAKPLKSMSFDRSFERWVNRGGR